MSIVLTEKAAHEVKRISLAETRTTSCGSASPAAVAAGSATLWALPRTSTNSRREVRIPRRAGGGRQADALYLDGTTVDFYEGIDRRGFTFDNPMR